MLPAAFVLTAATSSAAGYFIGVRGNSSVCHDVREKIIVKSKTVRPVNKAILEDIKKFQTKKAEKKTINDLCQDFEQTDISVASYEPVVTRTVRDQMLSLIKGFNPEKLNKVDPRPIDPRLSLLNEIKRTDKSKLKHAIPVKQSKAKDIHDLYSNTVSNIRRGKSQLKPINSKSIPFTAPENEVLKEIKGGISLKSISPLYIAITNELARRKERRSLLEEASRVRIGPFLEDIKNKNYKLYNVVDALIDSILERRELYLNEEIISLEDSLVS